MRVLALSLTGFLAISPAALGQQPTDRFQIEETAEGVLRLDRVTGAVDVCNVGDGGWECENVVAPASPPERDIADTQAWRDLVAEKARLEEEVARLERRLAMIAALVADADPAAMEPDDDTLTDTARREIDRAVEVTDYAVRRFGDLFRSLTEEDGAAQ
jgi:hypothetical protein